MAQAKHGDTVRVYYTLKLEDGTIVDSSMNRDPLQFTIGDGRIIPGFEQPVIGMNPGESKTIHIPADKAFGAYRKEKVSVMDRSEFPTDLKPEVGQRLQIGQEDGKKTVVTVTDVSESSVTLDANHPLAGKDLTFDIQRLEIV